MLIIIDTVHIKAEIGIASRIKTTRVMSHYTTAKVKYIDLAKPKNGVPRLGSSKPDQANPG